MSSAPHPCDRSSAEAYAALEKENRILRKKLERSEQDRQVLEANAERSEALMRKVIADLEMSKNSVEARGKELEATLQQLQLMQTQLVAAEKMSALGTLVAGIAHEINNPVSFVHGNLGHAQQYVDDLFTLLDAYQQAYPDPVVSVQVVLETVDLDFLQVDLRKLLGSMQVGTERIRDIVRSLRTFSRLDEADFKAADLHDGLESTLMILQHRLKACGDLPDVEVIREFDPLPKVECYPGKLNQVFMNLLTNAIDAVQDCYRIAPAPKPTPQITIKTALEGDRAVIHIVDNGTGIPDSIRAHLFNPFFTTKPVGKGTGMGLFISYQIVIEQHHGELYCQPTASGGTQFTIKIPCWQEGDCTT
ncbi:sensor histidine kinase [Leptolyngbya sp. AN02str]|uniref:sensor histidine kinase n=1 Tax=Leptolyngbya sp. AN02str TaxID=3423363 RepID=UPI003D31668E